MLDAFVDAGFNAIDTADSYSRWVPGHPGGESETIIGNWLKNSGKRDKVLIATKVGEDMGEGRSLKKDYILRACEASLRRLQTDRIDLYQTHFDDEVTPVEETMQAYAQLIAAGKVRAIGASNISRRGLWHRSPPASGSACRATRACSRSTICRTARNSRPSSQPICRREKHRRHQLLFARRRFSDRQISLGRGRRQDIRGAADGSSVISTRAALRILKALDEVAARHEATPAQIALAWLIAKPGITAPIVSATSLKQLAEIMKAPQIKLTREDVAALDAAGG